MEVVIVGKTDLEKAINTVGLDVEELLTDLESLKEELINRTDEDVVEYNEKEILKAQFLVERFEKAKSLFDELEIDVIAEQSV